MKSVTAQVAGVLVCTVMLAGCLQPRASRSDAPQQSAPVAGNISPAPVNIEFQQLQTGQIAVTDSGGPAALFFALFSEHFSPFAHTGIIVMEDDEPFVYETYGEIRPGLGRRPTDLVKGHVVRSPLAEFVRRGKYVEVYDLPAGINTTAVANYVRDHHARKTPFDPYFRYDERDSLYCTELSSLALSAGGWQMPALTPFPDNPSLTRVRHWLGINGPGTLQAHQLIEPDRLVGTLSILQQQQRFHVYIELKRELHRRFTASQKLGNLFAWDGKQLVFRKPIEDFIVQGLEMYRGKEVPAMPQVRSDIQHLALQLFGQIEG